MKIKQSFLTVFICILFLFAINEKVKAQHQPSADFSIGGLTVSTPDSIYKAKINVSTGDSLEVSSVHLVVLDSSVSVFDNQFVISNLPVVLSTTAWKEGNIIHIDIPDINPFKKKQYFIELLSGDDQLLFQIEKEF